MQYFEWSNIDLITGFPLADPVCEKRPKDPEIAPLKYSVKRKPPSEPKPKINKPGHSWRLLTDDKKARQLERVKEWRQKHREELKEYQRKYQQLYYHSYKKNKLSAATTAD